MSDTRTPGQRAHAGYWGLMATSRIWDDEPHFERDAWEAAAAAVSGELVGALEELLAAGDAAVRSDDTATGIRFGRADERARTALDSLRAALGKGDSHG